MNTICIFLLSDDDGNESSSSGSNQEGSGQHDRNRPPLLRKSALYNSQQHPTDTVSVYSENTASSVLDEPMRPRSRTNESMPILPKLATQQQRARGSTLATFNNGLSNSEHTLNYIKRSKTTGSTFSQPQKSGSTDHSKIHKPDTAPAHLGSNRQLHDSDASASSDSKESLNSSSHRRFKKLSNIRKLFKPKMHSSWCWSYFFLLLLKKQL